MTLKEILINYWSQITLMLGVIGYFIKQIYELNLKKEASRHSFFQQNKINTIMKFLSCYAKVEQNWQHIPHLKIIQNQLTAKQIDEIVWPSMNDLQGTLNELIIFLNEEELLVFENIVKSILELNAKLYSLYFKTSNETSIISMSNEFQSLRSTAFKENKKILLEVGAMTRKMFNS